MAAVFMAVVIGLIMAAIFERGEKRCENPVQPLTFEGDAGSEESGISRHRSAIFLALLVGVLLSATSKIESTTKWIFVAVFIASSAFMLIKYFSREERESFFGETWWLFKRIFPLLIAGTFITGVIGYFVPIELVRSIFGTNGLLACFVASVIGALLYMPTLLEVPIVGTLFGYSTGIMAPGPALALLLAGPSLSLPSMIVITRTIGVKKAGGFICLVVLISTIIGMIYGDIIS